jgi:hypothetical protein
MFQTKIEETKNNLNKESTMNGTVIQNFFDGVNIFITGGTGEFVFIKMLKFYLFLTAFHLNESLLLSAL